MLQALAQILPVVRALGPQRAPWGRGEGLGHGEPLRSIKGALDLRQSPWPCQAPQGHGKDNSKGHGRGEHLRAPKSTW